MPRLVRDDGAEIHWEERGHGPSIVLVPYVSGIPAVFEPLMGELAGDHRLITYDARGTGQSARTGPYDMETGAGDLEAVLDAAGAPAVMMSFGEGCNRAARVAARRPEEVPAIVGMAGAPVSRRVFAGTDAMAGSEMVVEALTEQIETDYRGAIRSIMRAGNPQMSEDEVRQRVQTQVSYCPQEVAVARMRAWIYDDPDEFARELGGRLWILYVPHRPAGAWFPPGREFAKRLRALLPDAHLEEIADGMISRPDLTGAVLRRLSSSLRAGAADPAT